jgi:hypothetical protein
MGNFTKNTLELITKRDSISDESEDSSNYNIKINKNMLVDDYIDKKNVYTNGELEKKDDYLEGINMSQKKEKQSIKDKLSNRRKEKKIRKKKEQDQKDKCKGIIVNMLKSRSRALIFQNAKKESNPSSNISSFRSKNEVLKSPVSSSVKSLSNSFNFKEEDVSDLWTDECVHQLIVFGDICISSANKCKKSSIRHRRFGNTIQILVIVIGALAAATSIGTLEDSSKVLLSTITGVSVAILTSIQSFLGFPQKAEIEGSSCLELERISRNVRIELSKPIESRVDPYKYIIRLENQREKIIRRVGIDDD